MINSLTAPVPEAEKSYQTSKISSTAGPTNKRKSQCHQSKPQSQSPPRPQQCPRNHLSALIQSASSTRPKQAQKQALSPAPPSRRPPSLTGKRLSLTTKPPLPPLKRPLQKVLSSCPLETSAAAQPPPLTAAISAPFLMLPPLATQSRSATLPHPRHPKITHRSPQHPQARP